MRGLLLRRLTPLNPKTKVLGMLCGISSPFGELFPFEGQITHVLRTRAPCAGSLYCYRKLRTRLACVKHAASVRSEPGSNSRLKLVVLKTKNPSKNARMSFRTNFLIVARFTQMPKLLTQIRFEPNGFWHILSNCQRAKPPVQQEVQ